MTARTARRAAVVEVKPDGSAPAVVILPTKVAGIRRTDRDSIASWTLELNAVEREMLAAHLTPLTEREREVVYAVCAGGQNTAIAERLYIALPTLRTHLMRINQKLGVRSKSETIRFVLARLLEAYRAGRSTALEGVKVAGPKRPTEGPEADSEGNNRGEENHRFR